MDAAHGPVMHAGGTKRAAVAAAVVEDAPGIERVPFILPGGLEHLGEVVGLGLSDTNGFQSAQVDGVSKRFAVFAIVLSLGSQRSPLNGCQL